MTLLFLQMKRNLTKHLIGCFLFGFLFIFSYWVGLPTDFNSDHLTINLQGAKTSSYQNLIKQVLDPRTPAWFYPTDRQMEHLRPLQFLWMKLYLDLFQSSLAPAHVTAAIGSGFLSVVFFALIFYWTESLLFAWLGVFLYASFPSNYFMLTSTFSFDFQYYISCLSLTALLTFSRLTLGRFKKGFAFAGAVLLWVAAIWLAIKLKSSEKVLPVICLAFLLWRFPLIRTRLKTWHRGLLFLALFGTSVLIVPLSSSSPAVPHGQDQAAVSKDKITFSFQWKNMLARTFFIPGGEFPFLAVWRHNVPRSFTENYGFFLGWLFWLNLILTPILLARRRSGDVNGTEETRQLKVHDFWMIFIWFVATIGGFANGLSIHDTRFLNFAYVPSVLLLFLMLHFLEMRFLSSSIKKAIFRITIAFFVLYTAIPNFETYAGLAMHFGAMQNATVEAERNIFRALYGKDPSGWELYLRHHELEERALVIDWYELPANWLEQAETKLKNSGVLYFYTHSPESERLKEFQKAGYSVLLWKRYDFLDAKPLVFRIAKAVNQLKEAIRGRAKKHEILVYRIEAPAFPKLP